MKKNENLDKYISKDQNINNSNLTHYKNAIKEIINICKSRSICKKYFAKGDSGNVQFIMIKSNKENESNEVKTKYHFIVNSHNPNLKSLAHPFTTVEEIENDEVSLKVDDKNYPLKEIKYYNKDLEKKKVFDFSLISNALSDNPNFNDPVKLDYLKTMLKDYTTMNPDDIN